MTRNGGGVRVVVGILLLCLFPIGGGFGTSASAGNKELQEIEVASQRKPLAAPQYSPKKWPWQFWWKEPEFLTKEEPTQNGLIKKKQKIRLKNETQKLANCRLLTNSARNHQKSPFHRLWRNVVSNKHNDQGRNSNAVDMNRAYEMMIMASLSYWDFQKKRTVTSFEVMSNTTGSPQPLRRRQSRLAKSSALLVSSLRLALDEALPWTSLIPSRRRRLSKGSRKSNNTSSKQHNPSSILNYYREKLRSFQNTMDYHRRHEIQRQRRHRIQLEYSFYDWYEPTPLGNFHDTDLLLATSNNGRTLIVAFAGTKSVTDSVTNLQTFEPARHSGFFSLTNNATARTNQSRNTGTKQGNAAKNNNLLRGSIHRGFLNAYTRTERGNILRLCADNNCTLQGEAFAALYQRYGHCTADGGRSKERKTTSSTHNDQPAKDNTAGTDHHATASSTGTTSRTETITWKRGRGCKIKHRKLMTVLRDLVTDYLSSGKSVHLTGHSLGGSIATLLALDVILNFPGVPVKNLELWTYGGAQVADDVFLESALQVAPRLKHFLQQEPQSPQPLSTNRGSHNVVSRLLKRASKRVAAARRRTTTSSSRSRFHRFVTVSDDCKVDFVSTVAQKTLAPDNHRNFHGKTARRIGGIQGARVVHLADPHYLLTPDQYDLSATSDQRGSKNDDEVSKNQGSTDSKVKKEAQAETPLSNKSAPPNSNRQPSSTRSSISAHACSNYLQGISRESIDHPLTTDFPVDVRKFLGEMIV